MDSRDGCPSPLPCLNGCGFFGNPATNDLCSKCHRDRCQRALRENLSAAEAEQTRKLAASAVPAASSAPSAPAPPSDEKPAVERCGRCVKKLRLCSRYECRCGTAFCSTHRLPETHGCTYDYKTAGRAAIAKANLLVVESKLERLRRGGN